MSQYPRFQKEFESFIDERSKKEPSWMRSIREKAFLRFSQLGFPTRKNEDWKYSKTTAIEKIPFQMATQNKTSFDKQTLQEIIDLELGKNYIVFIDGYYNEALSSTESLPKGVIVTSMMKAIESGNESLQAHLMKQSERDDDRMFAMLNLAFFTDGVFVDISENTVLDEPIHLIFVVSDDERSQVIQSRNVIVAGKFSRAEILESYVGQTERSYWTNMATELELAPTAKVGHIKFQNEPQEGVHLSHLYAHLNRDSHFSNYSLFFGGKFARNDVVAFLGSEGINCTVNGLYIANNKQHIDNRTFIDHAFPHCNSNELYKGILDDRGSGVFNGRIIVRQDAQQTDAQQSNQALLLSDNARIYNKPQLEIFADDVKCTHGAATGRLDSAAMFFLRSRGLTEEKAKHLLTFAFANEILTQIPNQAIQDSLETLLAKKLNK